MRDPKATTQAERSGAMFDVPVVDDLVATPYRWVRALAQGGMGEVHVVEHIDLGELRVMKILKRELTDQAEHFTARLRAEARILVSLRHRNLVEIRDFGFTGSGRAYLVTELLEGETVRQALTRADRFSAEASIRIAEQTLEGLTVVHERNLVHRDIKPDNLFLCRGSEPWLKILDFGVTKVLGAATRESVGLVAPTGMGLIIGTPGYVSPEQVLAEPVTARSDLYAVGCVLYQSLSGKSPFAGRPITELLEAHVVEQPRSLQEGFQVSRELDEIVLKALAKKPNDRFGSAREMLSALRALPTDTASADAKTPGPAARRPIRTVRMEPKEGPINLSNNPRANDLGDRPTAPLPTPPLQTPAAGPRLPAASSPSLVDSAETVLAPSPFFGATRFTPEKPGGLESASQPEPAKHASPPAKLSEQMVRVHAPVAPRVKQRPWNSGADARPGKTSSGLERAMPWVLSILIMLLVALIVFHFAGESSRDDPPQHGGLWPTEQSKYAAARSAGR